MSSQPPQATPSEQVDALFASAGEMAARIRALNWQETTLGPPGSWPQSLRTILSVCLASRFPMLIWWGRDLSVLYNDAYIPIFARKHPWVLGRTGREAWGEVWDVIGPMFEGVMTKGEATWSRDQLLVLERRGFVEEAYFTWSYSPIADETGGVGGVFTAVIETTERVLGERRLLTLRELGEQVAQAKTDEGAARAAADTLSKNPGDVPFALIYLLADAAEEARLTAVSRIAPEHPACVGTLRLADADAPWPIGDVVRQATPIMVDLRARWADLPGGLWPDPPTQAIVLPVKAVGQSLPHGVLIVGLSARLEFDDAYRGFVELAATHVASAIANAKAYEEERRRAETLAALDRAKTAFFSNVSHEFRTPLTLMQAPLEDLLCAPDVPPPHRDQLALVHRNGLRLQKLVNSLLDFSRLEGGRVQPCYEPTDLAEHTAALAGVFRAATDRAGLRLVIDCEPLGTPAYVDRDMWEKVVLNLVSNAFKFTLDGEIAVSLRRADRDAVLTVRDTGTGIPEEELPRIFDRFHRVAGARGRTQEGTGIGLALVHELVKLHGGTIAATSVPGHGSTFTVTLPLGTAHLPAAGRERESGPVVTTPATTPFVEEALRWLSPGDTSEAVALLTGDPVVPAAEAPPEASVRERVLLADDNADMREYVRRLLATRWEVETVANGREAVRAAMARPPDLVLTDVMMPELDGFGVLQALRECEATRQVPVMLLSARAGEESRVEGLQSGADDYLVKPFSSRELVARVEMQLLRRRIRAFEDAHRTRLMEVFAQAPAAIAIVRGPDHVFEMANPPYLALVHQRDVLGKPVREALPEMGAQGIIAILDRVYATGQPYAAKSLPLTVNRGPGGPPEERYFDFVYQPMRDSAGRVDGIAAVVYEVTELARARQVAESASRTKDEFLAMLGHELRNPLAPILTALQLLRLRGIEAGEKERLVIERQIRHLVGLVDDLLDVSRITRGKVHLNRVPVEVAEVVAKAIETASPLLEQQRHALEVAVPRAGLVIDADVDRLAQVVANLLTNAAKYTEPGGHVAVTAHRDGASAVITVRDTGIGISADMLPRIFESFVQEPQALDRARGGLGLGLAIVRSLVEMHEGTVSAHSDGPRKGAAFTVRLPLSARADERFQAAAADRPAPVTRTEVPRRVLIVDDNVDAAAMLAEWLAAVGHDVRVAHDGPEALAVAVAWLPEIAVLDLGLPVMDGYELARRLAERTPPPRQIAVTGYGQAEDRHRSAASGFAAHLVKPIDLEDLRALVEEP